MEKRLKELALFGVNERRKGRRGRLGNGTAQLMEQKRGNGEFEVEANAGDSRQGEDQAGERLEEEVALM